MRIKGRGREEGEEKAFKRGESAGGMSEDKGRRVFCIPQGDTFNGAICVVQVTLL